MDGMPHVDVLALCAQLGLWSSTEMATRVTHGGVYACVNRAPSLTPLFMEHVNGLCHHRSISTLI
jgi:hypothetical protein